MFHALTRAPSELEASYFCRRVFGIRKDWLVSKQVADFPNGCVPRRRLGEGEEGFKLSPMRL